MHRRYSALSTQSVCNKKKQACGGGSVLIGELRGDYKSDIHLRKEKKEVSVSLCLPKCCGFEESPQ